MLSTLIMSSVLVILIFFIFVPSLASIIVLSRNYRHYKKVYNSLSSREFYANHDQIYSHKQFEEDDGFVWFLSGNDFRLTKDVYIHNAPYTYYDPYSYYWLCKYRKWFRENLNIDKLQSYSS